MKIIYLMVFFLSVFTANVLAVYSCHESDGGNNIWTPGITFWNYDTNSSADYCYNSDYIVEIYCNYRINRGVEDLTNCGNDGYVGNAYCMNDNLYRDFSDYYCYNSYAYYNGNSYNSAACGVNTFPVMISDCPICCSNNQCSDICQ